jgi:hypothetical protein
MSTHTELFQQASPSSVQPDRERGCTAAQDFCGFSRFQTVPRNKGQYFSIRGAQGFECGRKGISIRNQVGDGRPGIGRIDCLRIASLHISPSPHRPPPIG